MGRDKDFYVGTLDTTSLVVGGVDVTASIGEVAALNGVTATAAELNMAADSSANVETVVTTNVITADESGKTFFLGHATGFTSTLPAPAAGLRFKFIVNVAPTTGNNVIATNAAAAIIYGTADVNGALVTSVAQKQINVVANTALVGDLVEVMSDGTSWFVRAAGNAAGSITFTAP